LIRPLAISLSLLLACAADEPEEPGLPDTCSDQIQSAGETDVDCGGECLPCANGLACASNDDCAQAFCHPGSYLCTAPACPDGFKNGGETDLDCGGSGCPSCVNGQICLLPSDCEQAFCHPDTYLCTAPDCADGYPNGDETGLDCGGPTCAARCPDGQGCAAPGDCAGGVCTGGICG
jgi:hypothetical protein